MAQPTESIHLAPSVEVAEGPAPQNRAVMPKGHNAGPALAIRSGQDHFFRSIAIQIGGQRTIFRPFSASRHAPEQAGLLVLVPRRFHCDNGVAGRSGEDQWPAVAAKVRGNDGPFPRDVPGEGLHPDVRAVPLEFG